MEYNKINNKICDCFSWSGVQKVGTAGTAGAGQITFGWTK
jgi:hypothetical protein